MFINIFDRNYSQLLHFSIFNANIYGIMNLVTTLLLFAYCKLYLVLESGSQKYFSNNHPTSRKFKS